MSQAFEASVVPAVAVELRADVIIIIELEHVLPFLLLWS
jgi:hypothetical protein